MEAFYIFVVSAFLWGSNLAETFAGSHYYNPHGMRDESSLNIEPISERSVLAEGPFWDDEMNQLYYVDIREQKVKRYDPYRKTTTAVSLDRSVTFVIPLKGERNRFAIGYGTAVAVLTWDGVSRLPDNVKILTNVANPNDGSQINDGKADAFGRLWSGTIGPPIGPSLEYVPYGGVLFRLTNTKTADIQARGVTISNGIAWSLDNKKMYYDDTGARVIFVFDYDIFRGAISNAKVLFDFEEEGVEGRPDGCTVDIEGKLWVACSQGSQIIRIDPETGTLLRSIKFPAYKVTNVVFGGPNYEELFVTSSREAITREQLQKFPLSGYTFRVTGLGVRGLPPRRVLL